MCNKSERLTEILKTTESCYNEFKKMLSMRRATPDEVVKRAYLGFGAFICDLTESMFFMLNGRSPAGGPLSIGILILDRSIIESLAYMLYIKENNSEQRARDYFMWIKSASKKEYTKVCRFQFSELAEHFKKSIPEEWLKGEVKNRWYDGSLNEIIERLCGGDIALYYGLFSDYVHLNPTIVTDMICKIGEEQTISEDKTLLLDPAFLVLGICLIETGKILADEFGADFPYDPLREQLMSLSLKDGSK